MLHVLSGIEVLKLCFPGGFFGEDREGHPTWWDCTGNQDPRGEELGFTLDCTQSCISLFTGLHRAVTREDILKFKCLHLEQMLALLHKVSAEKGRRIETISVVLDFANLSIQKHYHWPGIETLRAVRHSSYPPSLSPSSIHTTIIM